MSAPVNMITPRRSIPLKRKRQSEVHEDEQPVVEHSNTAASATSSSPTDSSQTSSPSKWSDVRHSASQALDEIKTTCARYSLLTYDSLPDWVKDNKHIKSGYRVNIGWRHSCESVCHLHNETVNVWTHIVAFLTMLVLLIMTLMVVSPHGADRLNLDVIVHPTKQIAQCAPDQICIHTNPQGTWNSNSFPSTSSTSSMTRGMTPINATHPFYAYRLLKDVLGATGQGQHMSSKHVEATSTAEVLAEVLTRMQSRVPHLKLLAASLRERAEELKENLVQWGEKAVGQNARKEFEEWKENMHQSMHKYMEQVEQELSELKHSLSDFGATHPGLVSKYEEVRELLSNNLAKLTPHLTLPHLDVVKVTKSMLQDFLSQLPSLSVSPTLEARAGVSVRVQSLGGLGSGDPYTVLGKSTTESNNQNSQQRQQHKHVKSDSSADDFSHTDFHLTYGFMEVDAHTDVNHPEHVELQLHSFLPRWPLTCFILSAMCCLLFSALFHLLQAVSFEMSMNMQSLDYAGICLLISGSTVPVLYYGFYCQPFWKWSYIAVCSGLGAYGFVIVTHPKFRKLEYRTLKLVIFISMGFFGVIPMIHWMMTLGEIHFILYYLLVMGGCYLTGAAIYLFQVPERFFPGRFDLFFASHQLWHISIFAAVLVHYLGLLHFYEWRMVRVCPVHH